MFVVRRGGWGWLCSGGHDGFGPVVCSHFFVSSWWVRPTPLPTLLPCSHHQSLSSLFAIVRIGQLGARLAVPRRSLVRAAVCTAVQGQVLELGE